MAKSMDTDTQNEVADKILNNEILEKKQKLNKNIDKLFDPIFNQYYNCKSQVFR